MSEEEVNENAQVRINLAARKDLVKCLLDMDLLPRLRYILEASLQPLTVFLDLFPSHVFEIPGIYDGYSAFFSPGCIVWAPLFLEQVMQPVGAFAQILDILIRFARHSLTWWVPYQ